MSHKPAYKWYSVSGTTTRGTLIQGPNRPQNAKRNQVHGACHLARLYNHSKPRPTVLLRSEGKEGLLNSSNSLQHPKSFTGPKEAQSSLGLRPTSAVRPIRGLSLTRGATSASLEASPPRPSKAHRTSASLEGSGSALGRADQFRLARGHPSADGASNPSPHLPVRQVH